MDRAYEDSILRCVMPHGLHVDTNNGQTLRHCSALVYLDDVDAAANGGSTLFPLANVAEGDPALAAARELLSRGVHHTNRGARFKATMPSTAEDAAKGAAAQEEQERLAALQRLLLCKGAAASGFLHHNCSPETMSGEGSGGGCSGGGGGGGGNRGSERDDS